MGGGSSDREPPEWLQSTTEFHQDWTERENRGASLRWKQGLSLEGGPARKYQVQVAPRRPRRWFFWLLLLAIAIGAIRWIAELR